MRMCKQKNKSNLEVRVQRRGLHVQLSAAAMAAVLFHILFSGVVLGIRLCFGKKKTMGKQRFFKRALPAHLRIYGFHKPIERMVLGLPYRFTNASSFILTAIVAADFAVSFKTAMELRDILDGMERIKDEMKKLQRRAEIMEAFIADSAEKRKEETMEELRRIREKQQMYRERNVSVERLLKRNPTAASRKYGTALKEYREQLLKGIREEIEERIKR